MFTTRTGGLTSVIKIGDILKLLNFSSKNFIRCKRSCLSNFNMVQFCVWRIVHSLQFRRLLYLVKHDPKKIPKRINNFLLKIALDKLSVPHQGQFCWHSRIVIPRWETVHTNFWWKKTFLSKFSPNIWTDLHWPVIANHRKRIGNS